MRFRSVFRLLLAALIMGSILVAVQPARANVSQLVLHRRTCEAVTAFVTYDSYSVGVSPFFVVFQADLNNNGAYGEAGEPTLYVQVTPGRGESIDVGARLTFNALDEGSTISVTAYEVDSAGRQISAPLTPISYPCTNRPVLTRLPSTPPPTTANAVVTAQITDASVNVYSGPSVTSTLIGGLAKGMVVNVTGRNARGDWAQIQFEGGTGWFMWNTSAFLWGPYQKLPVIADAQ